MIHYVPDLQLNAVRDNLIDLDIEAKHKNIAVLQMRKDFNIDAQTIQEEGSKPSMGCI